MELHLIVDSWATPISSNLWYVVSGCGRAPSQRVGATATYDASKGLLYVIGGADPSGSHGDVFKMRLRDDFAWDRCEAEGLKARYEHAAFRPASHPNSIFVFGGADANGNVNSIQIFDTTTETWSTPTVSGTPPSPRTYRVSEAACNGDHFYVFSGGDTGSQPVGDRQLHCFDALTLSWRALPAKGVAPKPRHGHTLVVVNGKVVIFGGMAGHSFYNDLTLYNLSTTEWTSVKTSKNWPGPRAAHGAVVIDDRVIVFGGMSSQGAMEDLWILDSRHWLWTRVNSQGPPPASRLDFSMAIVDVPSKMATTTAARMRTEGTLERRSDDLQSATASTTTTTTMESNVAETTKSAAATAENLADTSVAELRTIISGDDAKPDLRAISEEEQEAEANFNRMSLNGSVSPILREAAREMSDRDSPAVAAASKASVASTSTNRVDTSRSELKKTVVVVFGGMDTEGEIFDDTLLIHV